MSFFLVLFILFSLWLLSNIISLFQNYRRALTSNLPIVVCFPNPNNILWMVFSVPLRLPLEWLFPKWFNERFFKPTIYGWEFRDKYEFHRKFGSVFLLVNPGETELWIAEPGVAQSVLARRKDFAQSPIANKIMSILGPNLITVSSAFCLSYVLQQPYFYLQFFGLSNGYTCFLSVSRSPFTRPSCA